MARPGRQTVKNERYAKYLKPQKPPKNDTLEKMRGRPEVYRLLYDQHAFHLSLVGLNDEQLANFFLISTQNLAKWRERHSSFHAAINAGREEANGQVAKSLFQRATGYDNPNAVKMFYDKETGIVIKEKYTEHYPPDVTACIFWLVNRQRENWKRNVDGQGQGNDGGAGNTTNILQINVTLPPTSEGEERKYREQYEEPRTITVKKEEKE